MPFDIYGTDCSLKASLTDDRAAQAHAQHNETSCARTVLRSYIAWLSAKPLSVCVLRAGPYHKHKHPFSNGFKNNRLSPRSTRRAAPRHSCSHPLQRVLWKSGATAWRSREAVTSMCMSTIRRLFDPRATSCCHGFCP